jgi:hypothetical protein
MWQAADQANRFAHAKPVAIIGSEPMGSFPFACESLLSVAGVQSRPGSLFWLCCFSCGLSINRVDNTVFMKQVPEQDKEPERRLCDQSVSIHALP